MKGRPSSYCELSSRAKNVIINAWMADFKISEEPHFRYVWRPADTHWLVFGSPDERWIREVNCGHKTANEIVHFIRTFRAELENTLQNIILKRMK